MNHKIISSSIANNLYVLSKYQKWIKNFQSVQDIEKDYNMIYLSNLKKVSNSSKIQELVTLCGSLNLSQENLNIIINLGKFLKFEDLLPQENIAQNDLDISI
jgi:hypothetical protein